MARTAALPIVAAVVATTVTAGCGRSPQPPRRRPLAGTVVVDGVPAWSGAVSLSPRAGHAGPVATAAVREGRYAFSTTDGPTAGPHRAVIVFLRDAAEAAAFQPRHGKARPPRPPPEPANEAPDEPATADPDAAPPDAAGVADEPAPARAPPPNMREFEIDVPATDPPRLDFTIERGANP